MLEKSYLLKIMNLKNWKLNSYTIYHTETNVDPNFWTPDRVQAREELERKAQLRANVRLEGRKALLKRQKEFLDEEG